MCCQVSALGQHIHWWKDHVANNTYNKIFPILFMEYENLDIIDIKRDLRICECENHSCPHTNVLRPYV